jgi:hypothetical protein
MHACRLANKVGLQLHKKWTFHELFCEKVKTDQALYRLLFHMEAVDENGAISADEWEAASTCTHTHTPLHPRLRSLSHVLTVLAPCCCFVVVVVVVVVVERASRYLPGLRL